MDEQRLLGEVLVEQLDRASGEGPAKHQLLCSYREVGAGKLHVLMRREHSPVCLNTLRCTAERSSLKDNVMLPLTCALIPVT